MIHDKLPIATGDECFKLLTNQLAMVGYWPVMAVTGKSELGFDCGEGAYSVVGAPSRRWRRSAAEDLLALVLNVVHSAASFESTSENSPGLDTLRTDRLIALSSFSVWWCMAVVCWWSDLFG